ncbi:ImmA/IrrE family metallo-endopeptidase [Bacillus licheniformis]|uniref:ImmA/IrrE family metallo-endopeptidase n=1 Tax=Bacillus licheniformis TaxID=1402 RepID=UPI000934A03E|nr:ImmA/IrrE family metallo-endopeptidase [Bacillus licheniformis]HWO74305.1 ImmA/IrrE family metallo-endopeptidase [Bacillus sp. (in: firmicutes)]MDE1401211.1 ImmA/IrrE family metallo-endopeptidase [Bacillus licheniformis]MEC0477069.1 ImmA/IrrE family metallo-endopeptidase [Bacillus licheniformis]MEC0491541.1 ImmA/IrrE family metallo-endopeptidase [Bacillus licheniformis]OJT61268.1 peptidase [Bacillus licheniformis]
MILIYTSKNIKHKAENVVRELGTNNVYEICDSLQIIILKENLGCVHGFLQYYKEENEYIIHVNKKSNHPQIIIAHELGHFFLHKKLNTFQMEKCSLFLEAKLEHQANIFAAEILLTDKMLMDEMPRIQNWTHRQIASFFKVPLFVIEHKVSQLNLSSHKSPIREERNIVKFA